MGGRDWWEDCVWQRKYIVKTSQPIVIFYLYADDKRFPYSPHCGYSEIQYRTPCEKT